MAGPPVWHELSSLAQTIVVVARPVGQGVVKVTVVIGTGGGVGPYFWQELSALAQTHVVVVYPVGQGRVSVTVVTGTGARVGPLPFWQERSPLLQMTVVVTTPVGLVKVSVTVVNCVRVWVSVVVVVVVPLGPVIVINDVMTDGVALALMLVAVQFAGRVVSPA